MPESFSHWRRQAGLPGSRLPQARLNSTTMLSPTLPLSVLPISSSYSQSETSTTTPSSSTISTASIMPVTLPGSILPTGPSTGSTLPTPVASFAWSNFPSTIDTCTSPTLNWDYSGPQETLQFLLVSNVSPHTPGAISRKRAVSATTLAINVDAAAASWIWSKVNFTAGQYVVEAYGTDVAAVSSPFMITNDADTSCLNDVPKIHNGTTTVSTTLTTLSPEPLVTSMPTTSGRRAANAGVIAGGTVAGVVLIIALMGYRVWARRRRPITRSRYPTDATHGDLPSLYVASGTQAPPRTEKGAGSAHPLDSIGAADFPLAPNRRPPSSLLSDPYTPVPPYTPNGRSREREAVSLMDVSTIGSRSSAALSDATSTAGLMGTSSSSSCPPSYVTGRSPPPSYATDITCGETTPRSAHVSYASSS